MCNIRCRFDKLNKLIDLRKSQGITTAFSRVYRENNSKEMINIFIRFIVIIFLFYFSLFLNKPSHNTSNYALFPQPFQRYQHAQQ